MPQLILPGWLDRQPRLSQPPSANSPIKLRRRRPVTSPPSRSNNLARTWISMSSLWHRLGLAPMHLAWPLTLPLNPRSPMEGMSGIATRPRVRPRTFLIPAAVMSMRICRSSFISSAAPASPASKQAWLPLQASVPTPTSPVVLTRTLPGDSLLTIDDPLLVYFIGVFEVFNFRGNGSGLGVY